MQRTLSLLAALAVLAALSAAQCEVAALFPPTGEAGDRVGQVLDIEGEWAFIGLPGYFNGKDGRVTVYRRGAQGWALHSEVSPPTGGQHPSFGQVLSVGGGLLAVGERQSFRWTGALWVPNGGAVWLYRHDPLVDAWQLDGRLRPGDLPAGDEFSGRLDTDGDTVVIGHMLGPFGDDGRVEIWRRTANGWDHERVVGPANHTYFGERVRVSGSHLAVRTTGAYQQVRLYERGSAGWASLGQPPIAAPTVQQHLDLDGDRLVVSYLAPAAQTSYAAGVFDWNGQSWEQTATLARVGALTMRAAPYVAVDGQRVLAGDIEHHQFAVCNGSPWCGAGAVFLFEEGAGGSWSGERIRSPDLQWGEAFGGPLALSGDTFVAAALGNDRAGLDAGLVYLFRVPEVESRCAATPNSTGAPARLRLDGCTSIADDAATLVATSLPDTLGVFAYGTQAAQTPWGVGFACVGGLTARLGPFPISGGELSVPLDLALGPFTAGTTWHFQAWFVEAPGAATTFQTSDALEVVFTP